MHRMCIVLYAKLLDIITVFTYSYSIRESSAPDEESISFPCDHMYLLCRVIVIEKMDQELRGLIRSPL